MCHTLQAFPLGYRHAKNTSLAAINIAATACAKRNSAVLEDVEPCHTARRPALRRYIALDEGTDFDLLATKTLLHIFFLYCLNYVFPFVVLATEVLPVVACGPSELERRRQRVAKRTFPKCQLVHASHSGPQPFADRSNRHGFDRQLTVPSGSLAVSNRVLNTPNPTAARLLESNWRTHEIPDLFFRGVRTVKVLDCRIARPVAKTQHAYHARHDSLMVDLLGVQRLTSRLKPRSSFVPPVAAH
ncbi:hypothetical protein GQ600_16387 [Phytophthora cactorum]|nr:hypothetical protein GQ600_16387 [Phytophthora cactorum]